MSEDFDKNRAKAMVGLIVNPTLLPNVPANEGILWMVQQFQAAQRLKRWKTYLKTTSGLQGIWKARVIAAREDAFMRQLLWLSSSSQSSSPSSQSDPSQESA